MAAALQDVRGGRSVREATRLYNLPYETLRRRVVEKVDLECKFGPPTVLTEHEGDELASYCVKMADMGFGLSQSDIMVVAFKIAEASGRKHPFTDGAVGRAWYDSFRSRHRQLTLRSTQSLSRARASCANREIISDYFGQTGSSVCKMECVDEADEYFKHGRDKGRKVVTEIGRRNALAITSSEKGKSHTIITTISASRCNFKKNAILILPQI